MNQWLHCSVHFSMRQLSLLLSSQSRFISLSVDDHFKQETLLQKLYIWIVQIEPITCALFALCKKIVKNKVNIVVVGLTGESWESTYNKVQ